MTIERLQAQLHAVHARIGFEGRFCLSIDQDPHAACHVTHWFRPAKYAPEIWKTVGVGSIADCLTALESYADARRDGRAAEEAPPPADYYGIAAE